MTNVGTRSERVNPFVILASGFLRRSTIRLPRRSPAKAGASSFIALLSTFIKPVGDCFFLRRDFFANEN
jgi:hypothetical protein